MLEHLGPDTLFKIRKEWLQPLVYGVYRKGQYIYIGATHRGVKRVFETDKKQKRVVFEPDDEIHLWFPPVDELFATELYLIDQFKPLLQQHYVMRPMKETPEKLKKRKIARAKRKAKLEEFKKVDNALMSKWEAREKQRVLAIQKSLTLPPPWLVSQPSLPARIMPIPLGRAR